MAIVFGTYGAGKVLNAIFNATSFQVPTPYLSLHTDAPGLTGLNEHSGSGYGTRPAVEFDAAVAGVTQNTNVEVMPAATGDWPQSTHHGYWDAATGGNFLCGAALTTAKTVLNGETARFAIGDLDVSLAGMTEFSTTVLSAIVNAMLLNTELVYAATYLSIHSATPGQTGANELSGSGYARKAISWGAAASQACSNDAEILFATASGDWVQATHWGVWSALSAGTFICGGALTTPRTVLSGKAMRVVAGEITVTLE